MSEGPTNQFNHRHSITLITHWETSLIV